MDLAENRNRRRAVVNVKINFWFPLIEGKFLTRLESVSLSRMTLLR
jgi:hypothetical protein